MISLYIAAFAALLFFVLDKHKLKTLFPKPVRNCDICIIGWLCFILHVIMPEPESYADWPFLRLEFIYRYFLQWVLAAIMSRFLVN